MPKNKIKNSVSINTIKAHIVQLRPLYQPTDLYENLIPQVNKVLIIPISS